MTRNHLLYHQSMNENYATWACLESRVRSNDLELLTQKIWNKIANRHRSWVKRLGSWSLRLGSLGVALGPRPLHLEQHFLPLQQHPLLRPLHRATARNPNRPDYPCLQQHGENHAQGRPVQPGAKLEACRRRKANCQMWVSDSKCNRATLLFVDVHIIDSGPRLLEVWKSCWIWQLNFARGRGIFVFFQTDVSPKQIATLQHNACLTKSLLWSH